MGSKEQRSAQRTEIDHKASLHSQGMVLPNCRIKNFSAGGLYVECSEDEIRLLHSWDGDLNQARIELQTDQGRLSVEVRIIRTSSSGIGAAFLAQQPQLTAYLQQSIKPAAAPTRPASEPDQAVIDRLNQLAQRYLDLRLPAFLDSAQELLLQSASRLERASEQAALLQGADLLYQAQAEVTSQLLNRYANCLESGRCNREQRDLTAAPASADSDTLSLVDQDEFNEWVLVVGIARQAAESVSGPLYQLESQLLALRGYEVKGEQNPFSPYTLVWCLSDTLAALNIDQKARKIIYKTFQQRVLNPLPELYKALEQYLQEQGFQAAEPPQPRVTTPRHRASDNRPIRPEQPYSGLQRLGAMLETPPPATTDAAAPFANQAQLFNALEQLQLVAGLPLAQQLQQQLDRSGPGEQARLDPQIQQTVAATDQLLQSLQQDPRLLGQANRLLDSLQIPLVKEALKSPGVLNDPSHPLRRLLDGLDRLAPYTANKNRSSSELQQLNEMLAAVSQAAASGDSQQMLQRVEQLEAFAEQREQQFESHLSRVIQSSEAQRKRTQASEQIRNLLQQKLHNRSVSTALDLLLRFGWPGLLLETSLGRGTDSNRFKVYSNTLDFFLKVFDKKQQKPPVNGKQVQNLISVVSRGFDEYPVHTGSESTQFLKMLQLALIQGGVNYQIYIEQRLLIDQAYLDRLFDLQLPIRQPPPSPATEQLPWLELVGQIAVGDWIVEQRDPGQMRLINLAWRDPTGSPLVFVDANGDKTLEIDAPQLAERLSAGHYSLLEDDALPLIERSVQRAIEKSFSETQQSSHHDPLTNLLNRKGLELEIERLLRQTRAEGDHHLLMLLDIDQFSVVNDICGFDCGDQLLKEVATILTTYADKNAALARTGDDEFAILIEHCSLDRGYQLAESQRNALQAFKLQWGEITVPVTTSIGLTSITRDSGTPAELLKAAVSACDQAKQAGHNNCRIYRPDEQAISERQLLVRSVPVIEQTLEQGNLRLFGQLISPLFLGEGEDHYEVLLRVLDNQGNPGPPAEFIAAAEKYKRIRSVDRWIINHFFNWIGQHAGKLKDIGGFTLNLSGQSVMDSDFIDFIRQKLGNCGIPPSKLGFEITETAMMQNMDQANRFISQLREFGCSFYLDDFGSGYASYSHLKQLQVDYIKIDGVFITDMLEQQSSRAMVKSIVEVAHFMDKRVVAEFVESEALIIALRELEVDFAQGYAIGRPHALKKLIQAHDHYL